MNADIMAEWFRRQRKTVFYAAGSYWVEVGSRIFQAFPYHWVICPDDHEIQKELRRMRAIGIRYSTSLDSPEGAISYHVIHASKNYSLDLLPSKARYDVRKGLRNFRIEPTSFSRLASESWELRIDTLVRQRRTAAESQQWWERLCKSAIGLPGFECWGAIDIHTGKLASSLIAFICNNCFSILYQQSRTGYLHLGVNNALAYVVTCEALNRPEISEVFYGLHSLDAPASVDDFKFRMGFTAKPVRQRIAFHPWLQPFFNGAGFPVVRRLVTLMPRNPALSKAEGLMRFSLEGKRPIIDQQWPEALTEQKAGILQLFSKKE